MKKLTTILLLGIVLSSVNGQNVWSDTIYFEGEYLVIEKPVPNVYPINLVIEHETINLGTEKQETTLVFKNWPFAVRIFLRLKRAGLLRSMTPVKVGLRHEYHINIKHSDLFEYMPNNKYLVIPIRIQINNTK